MLAVVVGIGGGAVCFRHRTGDAPATDPSARRRYGIVVGVEFGVVAIVAAVLGASGHSAFISVAIAAVVGVHFYPLASILNDPGLQPLSVLTCLVAVVGLVAGIAGAVAPSAVVGPGVGILLTGYGAWGLVSPARRRISGHAAETR
ncbi:hypothetical protein [Nocardia terpenica]|uniref:Uncharacterized protein n=1 Tax=Nocardia terpenica TaxID=455432 RepID=A0A6G9Z4Q1_9NOCA|nr:hypothetical protein [Nocardia terpenica]QIS20156.1 hypothetical protein F6W96_19510 [Nocardia terpenica]